jgi:hypothetical protein
VAQGSTVSMSDLMFVTWSSNMLQTSLLKLNQHLTFLDHVEVWKCGLINGRGKGVSSSRVAFIVLFSLILVQLVG